MTGTALAFTEDKAVMPLTKDIEWNGASDPVVHILLAQAAVKAP